ncbi:FAD-dependent oxidoreductase [Usitatibacter palustris]|uniref:FAD-dependent oxidoreductase n=1 Tax=Usitatibacter palustris TaxID=2732487 RepID=UPI001487DF17|nr:FAD-dependent oxidoreductase [Usitatibacter palustris]
MAVATAASGCTTFATARPRSYDAVVVGAGVFGIWAAYKLHMAGRRVAVIDAVGPAHSGASSGGESRVTRCGYGEKEIYTEWAWRSIGDWQALSARSGLPIFHPMGVLWVHTQPSELVQASARVLSQRNIPFSLLAADELRRRFPVMRVGNDEAGFLEPAGGALMARRAVQSLASELKANGVTFLSGEVSPVRQEQGERGALTAVTTKSGERIDAEQFVFACGPWLDRICPDAMAKRLFVTRQEVFFFSVGAGATGDLPVWADLPFYGFPSLEGRGFKVADDTHGPPMDPDTTDRRASAAGEEAARAFLARRFPSLAKAPLNETRVCQYENSSTGHLVIDRHPGLDNVWVVGCGSGHGFKHGPAVGSHVAELVAGTAKPREPFLIAKKLRQQDRGVQ